MKLYLMKYHWYKPTAEKPAYSITATPPVNNNARLTHGAASTPTVKIINSYDCPYWDDDEDDVIWIYPTCEFSTPEEIEVYEWCEKQL